MVTAGVAGLGRHITGPRTQGAHVVVGDLDSAAGGQPSPRSSANGGAATFLATDVTDDGQLAELISAAARVGPLRALVNNAGGWSPRGSSSPTRHRRSGPRS